MPRAKAVLQSEFPYNISARCINREWFNIPMPKVWDIFCEEIARTTQEHTLLVHSFVLMSNHFHLIASTPKANISKCMHQLMGRTSRRLTREGNRINETFAGRHFKCILQRHNYYLNAYKYNYRNPVTAGICEAVEDYPYSTLHSLVRCSAALVPLCEDITYLSDPQGTLKWLNQTPDSKKLEGVRYGLKRQYFLSKKNRADNKPLIFDDDIL
jgi:REP element-mobilizing transposase RayT